MEMSRRHQSQLTGARLSYYHTLNSEHFCSPSCGQH